MTFLKSSAPFLAFLWIALLGLALSNPAHSAVIPSADLVSSYQANSLHRREPRASPSGAEESERITQAPESVYIRIKIKFEYEVIKGYAVWLNQSQLQAIKKDPRVKTIEEDSTVHTV
ncbi:hypothetical protein VP01_1396g7 [Puccinia sorghi]|uniref:Inhibitor I9 domain-containing protein n=1 Tax=Puccinia sorghi TaxID=27349 RepID=A0A0L6VMY4_9BASI|nr:hypothetical protein VP01_1396g7 [Puccinia sorghi]